MPKEINRHPIGRYRDGWKLIDFCTVCGAEELQLLQSECQGAMAMRYKKPVLNSHDYVPSAMYNCAVCGHTQEASVHTKEKFVSGLPD